MDKFKYKDKDILHRDDPRDMSHVTVASQFQHDGTALFVMSS